MDLLQQYIDLLVAKDAVGLSELFEETAKYDDTCISGMFNTQTHLVGKVAVEMHFYNRFVFGTYMVTGGRLIDEASAELDTVIVGQPQKVLVKLTEVSECGKIRRICLCPAEAA